MWRIIRTQLLLAAPLLFGVSLVVFIVMRVIPGDPVGSMVLMGGAQVTGEQMQQLRHELRLDQPLPLQYVDFVVGALQGDLGRSFRYNKTVTSLILEQLPATLQLAGAGLLVGVLLGLTLGVLAALRSGTWVDNACMIFAMFGWSMPGFWLGLLLIMIFSVQLGWFPITGQEGLARLILPALALGITEAGLIARLIRTGVLDVLRREYVTTARSKGLAESAVVLRHVLRNALIPAITMLGLELGRLLGGTVIIETVFGRQGVGRVIVDAITGRDFPVVQGAVLLLTAGYVVANLLVDLSYMYLDPRIRTSGPGG